LLQIETATLRKIGSHQNQVAGKNTGPLKTHAFPNNPGTVTVSLSPKIENGDGPALFPRTSLFHPPNTTGNRAASGNWPCDFLFRAMSIRF
jgi:hypothetical protein